MISGRVVRILQAGGCVAALAATTAWAQTQPAILNEIGIDQKLGAQLPLELEFRDSNGNAVRLGQFFDGRKPAILTLVYYQCPMLCTLALNDTVRALKEIPQTIGEDFDVITVSFHPHETPGLAAAKKRNYVQAYGRESAEKGWHFLVGDETAINRLTRTVGFRYRWDENTNQYAHPTGLIVLTPTGAVARYFFGIGYDPKDVRLSLVEASQRKIGSFTDYLLLSCYHFDPNQGKYTWAVMSTVRAGGVMTLAGLGTLIVFLLRRERKQGASPVAETDTAPSPAGHRSDDR
ncbi:MAG TPA: SCO family protein [Phycisphaerae bacterium]|nr:SCO family protein [Phycisphaerae bacterium]HOM52951.1 SCO family protein [Phycisphaerae bacterium]HON69388.1 SCO family protein [Phycisphaerae bacterium]HOQ86297.1 SCO family protein [Phycisphaerae bacterium]HPU27088.1 SCO family protein [Phycisphaerae bacterium]